MKKPEQKKDGSFSVHVMPENITVNCPPKRLLMEVLMEAGLMLNAACGGAGGCGKCAVRITHGQHACEPTQSDQRLIPPEDIEAGFRLACRMPVTRNLRIAIPEESRVTPVHMTKADASALLAGRIAPSGGASGRRLTIAVDLGTTTIGIYGCDRSTGQVVDNVAVRNPQAIFGADVISRIASVTGNPSRLKRIQELAVRTIDWAVALICRRQQAPAQSIDKITVVGNTTMIHLLLGADPAPIGLYPFEPAFTKSRQIRAGDLGFQVQPDAVVETPPLISGFLGCDILAAAVATRLDESPPGTLLADLGTNGELLLKSRTGFFATSSATGPAFEGGNIRHGMQAMPGAIDRVFYDPVQDRIDLSIIQATGGNSAPAAGICGAGFMSAVAAMVRHRIVRPDGAFNPECGSRHLVANSHRESRFRLTPAQGKPKRRAVALYQKDVRAMQLAKAAVAAGILMLCKHAGIHRPHKIILAGAMGNYMDITDARAVGLFPDQVPVETAGNAAGAGALLAAMDPGTAAHLNELAGRIQPINLSTDARFQAVFIKELGFPEGCGRPIGPA